MSTAVPLREDFTADDLRRLARGSRDACQSRRLLALAQIYDGGTRTDAARTGVVGWQTVRDSRAGLQQRRSGWPDRPQGARPSAQAEPGAALGACRDRRERAGSGSAWRRALAAQGSGGLDLRQLRDQPG